MKKTNQRLLIQVATALLVSGTAFAAEPPTATSADSGSAPAKHAVKPHNHMRDAKGMGMGDKHGASAASNASSAEATKDESGKQDEAGKQESHEKNGVKPHNHPRDAKAA